MTILSHTQIIKSMITFNSNLIALSKDNTKFMISNINQDQNPTSSEQEDTNSEDHLGPLFYIYKFDQNKFEIKSDCPPTQEPFQAMCISPDNRYLFCSFNNHLYRYDFGTNDLNNKITGSLIITLAQWFVLEMLI